MTTTVRWKCPSCDARGEFALKLPFGLHHLEQKIHMRHWAMREEMKNPPSICTPVEIDLDALPEVPELKDAKPIVLYFGSDADRAEFEALMRAAKPGMITRSL